MGNAKKKTMELDTFVDESFDLNTSFSTDDEFVLDTSVSDDADDFFHEFNKPSTLERKKTKQERLHEYKKINTKMPPELHRMLKVYCSQNDFKKNDVFKTALEVFMSKFDENEMEISNQINGKEINIVLNNQDKKSYNFEVTLEFFKEVKTYASMRDVKLVVLYEQAIINYLHDKRFSL